MTILKRLCGMLVCLTLMISVSASAGTKLQAGTIIETRDGSRIMLPQIRYLMTREELERSLAGAAAQERCKVSLADCEAQRRGMVPKPGFWQTPKGKAATWVLTTVAVGAAFIGGGVTVQQLSKK